MEQLNILSQKEQKAISELVELLQSRYGSGVAGIKLFGSKARGNFTAESDIDLLVVFDREVDWKFRDEINSLIFPINLKYDMFLSARIYSTNRLNEERIKALPFIKSIQKHGITIL